MLMKLLRVSLKISRFINVDQYEKESELTKK